MGVAAGDYNGDGRTDLFITNSRHQLHAAFEARPVAAGHGASFVNTQSVFNTALGDRSTVGWGDSWVDFANSGFPNLIIANGAIPVTSLKQDTEPIQVLENLGVVGKPGQFTNASGIIDRHLGRVNHHGVGGDLERVHAALAVNLIPALE